jgi:TonB family protein
VPDAQDTFAAAFVLEQIGAPEPETRISPVYGSLPTREIGVVGALGVSLLVLVNRPILSAAVLLLVFVFSALVASAETAAKRLYIPIDTVILQDSWVRKSSPADHYRQTPEQIRRAEEQSDRMLCLKADVRRQIKRQWQAPIVKQKAPVAVSFTLWNTGLATDIHVSKSSRSAVLDRSAMYAVAAASPFKFPPKKPMKIEIVFDQRMNSGLAASLGAVQVADFTY